MICELCSKEHDGSYGSGRFCSKKCAKSFSSKEKRQETNQKISFKLKGKTNSLKGTKGHPITPEISAKISKSILLNTQLKRENYIKRWKLGLETGIGYNGRPHKYIGHYIKEKFDKKCSKCGWKGENPSSHKSVLEINHIDGNKENCNEKNLELLCPNCHSLTPKYRNHGGHPKIKISE